MKSQNHDIRPCRTTSGVGGGKACHHSVDPCGERGEFHTFCFAGPMFAAPIAVQVGEATLRDGFWFVDLLPAGIENRRA